MSPSYRLLDVLSQWRDHAKGRLTCLVVVAWLLGVTAASAQVPWMPGRRARPGAEAAEETPSPGGVLPGAAHETLERLTLGRKAIEAGEYAEAATILQSLLAAGVEDGFIAPADGDATQTTLRREVRRLLGAMPREGRHDYQLLFGPQAESLLKAAVEAGDCRALARIADEFFHTQAGYQAVMLLAYDRMDRGEPREAIGWLRRIGESPTAIEACEPGYWLLLTTSWLAAGDVGQAREAFTRLQSRCRGAKFGVGQRRFVAGRDQAEAWGVLEKLARKEPGPADCWTMFRGDAARNALSTFSGKLGQREWEVQLAEREDLDQLRSWRKSSLQRGAPPLSAVHALVVGNTVLTRSPYQLVALDFASGRRIWEFPWETAEEDEQDEYLISYPKIFTREIELVCRSAPYGQLSSDGRLVFLLDRLAPILSGPVDFIHHRRKRKPDPIPSINRLVALDTQKEGRLAWSVGGEGGEDEPKLAGAFFLGPPLPDGPRLYVLAEIKGEILLCQLHAATGRLAWSQMIAHPGQRITLDQRRRLAGATPSFAEGVLVCPTSADAAVGVDPTQRALRWAYPYPRADQWQTTWADAAATIADGRVLLTPADSDLLYCLDLQSGREVWSCRRNGLLLVACVHQGKVVLVGPHEVAALRLADRKPAWKSPLALPADAMPSGRGLYTGRFYYLPTTAKALLQIDLDTGRIAGKIETKEALGNLVGVRGRLISQTGEHVELLGAAQTSAARAAKN
jgi:outer membrane protein assembly factor BamB